MFYQQEELGSDHESNLEGTKRQDHTVLCNLVNLYKDLMMGKEIDRGALAQWLPQLIPLIVKRSTSYPLVSAFYKLLAAAFYIASRTNYFKVSWESVKLVWYLHFSVVNVLYNNYT